MSFSKQLKIIFSSVVMLTIFLFGFALSARADLINDLKSKIANKNSEIEKIEKEITEYKNEINDLGRQANTLNNSIRKLNTTKKKLEADIRVTQVKINSSSLKIEKLGLEIEEKGTLINNSNNSISEIIRKIDEEETHSFIEVLLSNDTFSAFLDDVENLRQLQSIVSQNLKELESLKSDLEEIKQENQIQQNSLISSRVELKDRKKITENNKKEKNALLSVTKNKESNYKKLLKEKEELKAEFERELLDIESQLRIVIDPNSIPTAGSGVLSAPLSDISYKLCKNGSNAKNCLTQFFGNTDFARSGAYSGKGHNGTDFRASVGTKVRAALSGVIKGFGNTDAVPGCLSYGKWVLIEHGNGLSTLYAHLSLISDKIKVGTSVSTKDIIGYSGNTGFSTGPHLHFTVYASEGVKVTRLGDIKGRRKTKCSPASIPIAPFNAYLNPLDYL